MSKETIKPKVKPKKPPKTLRQLPPFVYLSNVLRQYAGDKLPYSSLAVPSGKIGPKILLGSIREFLYEKIASSDVVLFDVHSLELIPLWERDVVLQHLGAKNQSECFEGIGFSSGRDYCIDAEKLDAVLSPIRSIPPLSSQIIIRGETLPATDVPPTTPALSVVEEAEIESSWTAPKPLSAEYLLNRRASGRYQALRDYVPRIFPRAIDKNKHKNSAKNDCSVSFVTAKQGAEHKDGMGLEKLFPQWGEIAGKRDDLTRSTALPMFVDLIPRRSIARSVVELKTKKDKKHESAFATEPKTTASYIDSEGHLYLKGKFNIKGDPALWLDWVSAEKVTKISLLDQRKAVWQARLQQMYESGETQGWTHKALCIELAKRLKDELPPSELSRKSPSAGLIMRVTRDPGHRGPGGRRPKPS